MNNQSIEEACRSACISTGVDFKHVPQDGQFYTADLTDDHKGKSDGRIKIFSDSQGGIVCNHKSGEQRIFFINRKPGEPAPTVDREHIKREQQRRSSEQKAGYDKAAHKTLAIWQAAKLAPANHPYLVRKQIKAHGSRAGSWARSIKDGSGKFQKIVVENCLLIPLYNEAAELRSLQAIFPAKHPAFERDKDFLPGAGLAGLFWWIGAKTEKVLVAEGFATAASLHEATGFRVYAAFSANNLMAVGKVIREKLPEAMIIFCGDNDTQTLGNPGRTKAAEAAQAVHGGVSMPPISGDWNDYAILLNGMDQHAE
ncbi:MAG: toprim domain-containing protein [Methylococcaceae bacterium]